MRPGTAERWAWILLYGGLLTLVLGLAVRAFDSALGTVMGIGGAIIAASGAALVVVRSRMPP